MCVCTEYIYYAYINTHTCMYILKKNFVYIFKYIYILYDINYMNINICKTICCMCVFIYVFHNKYTQYTQIYHVNKIV